MRYREATGSVAVAEIPEGGYFVAASGERSFTVFAFPFNAAGGSIKTSLMANKAARESLLSS